METRTAPISRRTLQEVTLPGNWVLLEPLRRAHAKELWAVAKGAGFFEHFAPGIGESYGEMVQWIDRRIAEQELDVNQSFLMRDPATKQAVGSTSFINISTRHKRVEIGHTWVAKSHQRTATNTEAKLLMLQHAFEDWKALRVQFKADARNERAQQALERIGATREGIMRNGRVQRDGYLSDMVVYSIIDTEWKEVKRRLNRYLWDR